MSNPKDEANQLIDLLYDGYGTGGKTDRQIPWIDGKEAITEMKDAGYTRWQEVEWAGYYIKFLLQKGIEEKNLEGIHGVIQQKWHFFEGDHIWDIRLHADPERDIVILGDIDGYLKSVERNAGIGIIVADVHANLDFDGTFLEWHEKLKGGPSSYTQEREREGRRVRERKTQFFFKKVFAYYFPYEEFRKGVERDWIKANFQKGMRNADESPRNAKYTLIQKKVPKKYLLSIRNFNEDYYEFREDYPKFVD